MKFEKAQVSLEVLILISILIIGATIIAILFLGNVESAKDSSNDSGINNITKNFKKDAQDYFGLSAEIIHPTPGTYTVGNNIDFEAVYDNNSGPVTCNWVSDQGWTKNDNCEFSDNSLSDNDHLITLTAIDSNNTVQDTVNISVN